MTAGQMMRIQRDLLSKAEGHYWSRLVEEDRRKEEEGDAYVPPTARHWFDKPSTDSLTCSHL